MKRPRAYALVLAATLTVFGQAVTFRFTGFDDQTYVTENPQVLSGLTPSGIAWAFTALRGSNWHPLTWLSLMLDAQVGGGSAAVFHATNVLLHAFNALLLLFLLERATGFLWRSAFVAALFAVHPLHVESVAWIAERKDVLSTLFLFLALIAYLRHAESPSRSRYVAVVVAFTLGLMAKPMLVTLPILLLLFDVWPLRRWPPSRSATQRPLVLEKVPLLVLSAASCAITLVAQHRGGAIAPFERFPLLLRIENAIVSYGSYLLRMLWPCGLAAPYPPPASSLPAWKVLVCASILVGITLFAVRCARTYPYVLIGWLWYLIALVPVIGIVQVGTQSMADRYTYVPLIGIFVIVAWGAADLARRTTPGRAPAPNSKAAAPGSKRRGSKASALRPAHEVRGPGPAGAYSRAALAATAGAVIVALMAVSFLQARHWRDRIALFGHLTRVQPDFAFGHNILGAALCQQGRVAEGMNALREALRLDPRYLDARNNLGIALFQSGRTSEALVQFREAVRLDPSSTAARSNLEKALAAEWKPALTGE